MKQEKSFGETLRWHKENGYVLRGIDCTGGDNCYVELEKPAGEDRFPACAFLAFNKRALDGVLLLCRETFRDQVLQDANAN